ncbi:MAG: patatin-like phospholipase family protein [Bacteroidales bacterium]
MNRLEQLLRTGREFKTGIILSGGGVRGFAHAGILKALNEADIYPDVISGVSAGAIVGALYADGYSPEEIFGIFKEDNSFFKYARIKIPGRGLFKTVGLRSNLTKHLRTKNLEDLKIPLIIAATNMTRGEVVYFDEGEILDRVMASAAIPILFEPVEIDGDLYIDGGVLDNFPVSPLVKKCRQLIGVSLNPIHPEKDFDHLFKIAERAFRLSVSSNISPKVSLCDQIFEPEELGKYGLLDASKGEKIFEMGYKTAKKQLKEE